MNFKEAVELIEHESLEGIAYTSRFGKYPSKADFETTLEALEVVHRELSGVKTIDRKLASALFSLGDQVQGNYGGAIAKGYKINSDFNGEDLAKLNELLYAIFEEH